MKVGTIFPYGQCFYFGKMVHWTFRQKKARYIDGIRIVWECRLPREISGYDTTPLEALEDLLTAAQYFSNRFNQGQIVKLHMEKVVVQCELWKL